LNFFVGYIKSNKKHDRVDFYDNSMATLIIYSGESKIHLNNKLNTIWNNIYCN